MINKFKKKQDDSRNTINPVVVEAAGVVAVTGFKIAMALRNKKTREKVGKTLLNMKDQLVNYVETLQMGPDKKMKGKSIS